MPNSFAIKIASQNKTRFAVLFLDLDRFKLINDSLSHHSGDIVLQMASARIQQMVRSEDVLARLGGDEFVIVLTNLGEKETLEDKILKIANNKLVSTEALIRWNHPTKGILLPIDFIPLAEETELIIPIPAKDFEAFLKDSKYQ